MPIRFGDRQLRLTALVLSSCCACSAPGEVADGQVGALRLPVSQAIPGRIQAEAYVRALDSSPGVNYGAYVARCDRHDGVDISSSTDANGAGCRVGWTTNGEWLEYDVIASSAQTIDIVTHVASDLQSRTFHLAIDGQSLPAQTVPSDGTWAGVAVTFPSVTLTSGQHVLRMTFDSDALDFDYFDFVASATQPACAQQLIAPVQAVASSIQDGSLPAAFAIDSELATRWSSAFSDPQWIYVDLGTTRMVSRVVLSWEFAASRNYEIGVSESSAGPWRVVAAKTTGYGGVDDMSFAPVATRFVRLNSTARTTSYGISLYDFAILGDPDPSCSAPACANSDAMNSTPLTLARSDIGAREVLSGIDGGVRVARDPGSGKLVYLTGDGRVFGVSLATGSDSSSKILVDATQIMADTDLVPSSFQGMAFAPNGDLYVVANVSSGRTNRGIVRRGRGVEPRTWGTFAQTEPYPDSNTPFDHHFNGIVVSPDGGWVYLASGSRTDHGEVQDNGGVFPGIREVPLTSSIFRLPASGSELLLVNDEAALAAAGYRFASGLRNSFDPEFGPGGELFAGDNGPDADYSDELNVVRAGGRYGFPWRLGAENNEQQFASYYPVRKADGTWSDPRLHSGFTAVDKGLYENDPTFPAAPVGLVDPILNHGPDADQFRDPKTGNALDASALGATISTFTAHRSPLGLSFDLSGALCGDFKNSAFILSWGAAQPVFSDQGSDLQLLTLTSNSTENRYHVSTRQLVTGLANPIDSVLVGNKLYVLENGGGGHLWEFSFPVAAP